MRKATSFLFPDGVEVQARECNYLSYKEQCLVCPECHLPVILASLESTKQIPHFRHRKLKEGEEEKANCSERAKPLTQKEIAAMQSRQRNQRIKFLNRHIWYVIKESLSQTNIERMVETSLEPLKETGLLDKLAVEFRLAYKNGSLKKVIHNFKDYMASEGEKNPKIAGFVESLNLEIQVRSVEGVCDFLSIKSSYPILERLLCFALWDYSRYSQRDSYNFPPPSKVFLPVTWTIADVVAMMMVVPWQEAMFAAKVGEPIPKGITTRPRLTTGLVSF